MIALFFWVSWNDSSTVYICSVSCTVSISVSILYFYFCISGSGVLHKHIPGKRSVITCLDNVRDLKKHVQVYNITEIDQTSWKGPDSIIESHGKFIGGLDPTRLNRSRSPRWIPLQHTPANAQVFQVYIWPSKTLEKLLAHISVISAFFLVRFWQQLISLSTFPISLPRE